MSRLLSTALPPNTWFHGSQFTSVGAGSSSSSSISLEAITEFTHIIRCVVMTALGMPVDPEVKRYFATVS